MFNYNQLYIHILYHIVLYLHRLVWFNHCLTLVIFAYYSEATYIQHILVYYA